MISRYFLRQSRNDIPFRGMLELHWVLWTVFWKSRDLVQTVEKTLDQKCFFISAKKYFKTFSKFWFSNCSSKISKLRKNWFSKCFEFFGNQRFSIFDFFRRKYWKPKFWKIFSKYVFAEMKKYVWSRFFLLSGRSL